MASAVAENETATLGDLKLSPEELAEEAAEAAASAERELGAVPEAVQAVYDETYARVLGEAQQAELDGSPSKADELREHAGEAVGEMPAGAPQSTDVPPETLAVSGPSSGKRKWSGKAPGMVVLNVKAMKIEVPEGDFKKGERFVFEGEAVVTSEGVKDKLDKDTKTAVEAVQTHDAVVLDFALTDADED